MAEAPIAPRRRVRDALLDWGEDVLSGVLGHPVRSVALALVFALGSGGAVTALGVSATAAHQVSERLTAAALDQLSVRPVRASDGRLRGFGEEEVRRIVRSPDARAAGVTWTVSGPLSRVGRTREAALRQERAGRGPGVSVIGATAGVFDVADALVSPATAPSLLSAGAATRIAILGPDAASALGVTSAGPGMRVYLGQTPFEVVGIVTDVGRGALLSNAVVIPRAPALALSGNDPDTVLHVRTVPGRAFAVSQIAAALLRPDRPGDVEVEAVPDLRRLRRGVATDLDNAVGFLAALMLLLAAITTANVMTMSVNERVGEVALRRAVGMSRARVGNVFLGEGFVVGSFGGIVGVACGVLAVIGVAELHDWQAVLPGYLVPVGVVLGALVGLASAARAARAASRIDPALAVRR